MASTDAQAGAGGAASRGSSLIRSLVSLVRPFVDDVIAVAAPGECRVCGCALARAVAFPVCDGCRASVEAQTGGLCGRCGEALGMESARFVDGFGPAEGVMCTPCRLVPPMFERAVAYSVYEDEARAMLHLLKYQRMRPLAGTLGGLLARAVMNLRGHAGEELLLTAVPLYVGKERWRGFNQSDLLARGALKALNANAPGWRFHYVPELLERRRDTKTQAGLNPRGRRRNLQGAFKVREKALAAGAEVLVVDDIYTTGATARECARVLRRAGASKVWVATLARAQKPQVELWDAERVRAPMGFG